MFIGSGRVPGFRTSREVNCGVKSVFEVRSSMNSMTQPKGETEVANEMVVG